MTEIELSQLILQCASKNVWLEIWDDASGWLGLLAFLFIIGRFF
jgi:hypothetical protein